MARTVIGRGRRVIVHRTRIGTTHGVRGLLCTGVTASVGVARGRPGGREAVGVIRIVRHGSTGQSLLRIVHQVLLGSPVVDHVLVLHIAGRNADIDAVHAIAICIRQGVVRFCTAPTAPGAGHMDGGEGLPCTVHVHRERRRGGQAVAVAIEVGRGIGAGSVVVGGCAVVVAGRLVRATVHRAGDLGKAKRVFKQEILIASFKDLDEELATDLAVGRRLSEEDLLVVTGNAVGTARQNVPSAADGRADVHIAPCTESNFPGGDIRIHECGHFGLTCRQEWRLLNSDRDPAVILHTLESRRRIQGRVDRGWRGAPHHVLIERRGGVEEQGRVLISNHSRHEVVGVGRGEVYAIGRHSVHAIRGVRLDRQAEAIGVSSVLETGILSGC